MRKQYPLKAFLRTSTFAIAFLCSTSLFAFTSTKHSSNSLQESIVSSDTTEFVIAKETKWLELDMLKKRLEKEGILIEFSGLSYNDENNMTGITINYHLETNNPGRYSVAGVKPIRTIFIYLVDGKLTLKNRDTETYQFANTQEWQRNQKKLEAEKKRNEQAKEREQEREARRQEIEARRKEMEREREEKRNQLLEERRRARNQE